MTGSTRRLGRSPERKVDIMDLACLHQEYMLSHQALGRSPKTISHHRDTFRSFGLFLEERGDAATTATMTTKVMNEFALWLRNTPTRGFRGSTVRTEVGIKGTMTDIRAFVRWMAESGHINSIPVVPVPKLPRVFFPILSDEDIDTVVATKQLSMKTEIGHPAMGRKRPLLAPL